MATHTLTKQPDWRFICSHPAAFLAFGLGSGLAKVMPGTAGTLAAIPLYLLMSVLPLPIYVAITVIAFAVGIYLCHATSRMLGVHDHGGIVWDEFVGFWIAMIAVPPGVMTVIVGFLVFRVLDMAKPWPISIADKKVHGGLGIMLDDVIAGVGTAIVLHLGLFFLSE